MILLPMNDQLIGSPAGRVSAGFFFMGLSAGPTFGSIRGPERLCGSAIR